MSAWERERDVQNEYLRKQLAALRSGPRARWRLFRMLVIICGRCGDAVLEVMRLDPYPVILARRTVEHPSAEVLPADVSLEARIAHMQERLAPIRLDNHWTFDPIAWPLPVAPPQSPGSFGGLRTLVNCACRCRQYSFYEETIFDDLRAGREKRVVPAPP